TPLFRSPTAGAIGPHLPLGSTGTPAPARPGVSESTGPGHPGRVSLGGYPQHRRRERSVSTTTPPEAGSATMFTTTWCGYCRRLKTQMDREGIAYSEVNRSEERRVGKEWGSWWSR